MTTTQALTHATPTPSTLTHALSTEPLPQKWVAKVFDRLAGQLGSKLADLYGGVKPHLVQAEWAQGLAGFSGDEIARGLAACQTRKFAPTLGEFLLLCRPSLDAEIAWHEAAEGLSARARGELGDWSHPAVYRAACVLRDGLRQGNWRACKNRWEHVLRSEFAKGFVAEVPPVALALAHNPHLAPMPESVRLALAARGLVLRSSK